MPHELGGPGTMGVADLLLGTGPVVQVVLWTLVLFSVVSWGIIIYKLNQISHARRESDRFIALFWESKNLAAIHSGSVGLIRSPVAQVFRAGYQELLQLTRAKRQAVGAESGFSTDLGGVENVTRAMRRQANVETTKLEKGITFLATTGSTCPFIGLVRHGMGNHDGLHRALGGSFLEHPGGRPRHRRGAHHHRDRPGRRDSGADVLQLFHRPGARARDRNGKFHLRISQHRRASFPVVRTPAPKGAQRMAFEPGQRGQFASQINVTPLVDVMLVLLVIFMVTAPMIQQGVEVSVPRVKASALPGKEEQFVVSITRNQEVYLNDTKLGLDQLTEKLQAIAVARPDREVFVRADEEVPYGVVIKTMAAIKAAGIENVGMVTEMPQAGADAAAGGSLGGSAKP